MTMLLWLRFRLAAPVCLSCSAAGRGRISMTRVWIPCIHHADRAVNGWGALVADPTAPAMPTAASPLDVDGPHPGRQAGERRIDSLPEFGRERALNELARGLRVRRHRTEEEDLVIEREQQRREVLDVDIAEDGVVVFDVDPDE